MSKNILFRADSSSYIGTGHISRDLTFAKKYKNNNIIFASQNLKGNINSSIKNHGYKLEILFSDKISELISLINKHKIDLLIIDHYGINYQDEKKIKKETGVKILSFDDTYEKHYCDILLNHNISANKNKYKGLVPKKCQVLCGKKYTILRDEFYKEKKKKYKKSNIQTIFIAMGGTDHSNINIDILKTIKSLHKKNLSVILVTTTANENIKQLKKYCRNKKWINLQINSTQIASLISQSSLAIITPSVTANEVSYMSKPFIAIKTANNQKEMYKYLKKKNIPVLKSFNKYKLIRKIKLYWKNND